MSDGLKRAARAAKRTNYDKRDAARLALYPKLVETIREIIDTGHPDMDKCLDCLDQARKIERDSR